MRHCGEFKQICTSCSSSTINQGAFQRVSREPLQEVKKHINAPSASCTDHSIDFSALSLIVPSSTHNQRATGHQGYAAASYLLDIAKAEAIESSYATTMAVLPCHAFTIQCGNL